MDELSPLSAATVLITGAHGMLGRAFVEILGAVPGCRVLALGHDQLDVTDRKAVMALAGRRPDWIVHCAADVNADRCEENPVSCRAVQVGGSENVAALAQACDARVLYPQSFLIFDGRQNPIVEDTAPNPLSVYGQCKLDAEALLRRQLDDRALVIRMAGFFGGDEKDKNFVGKFTRHARKLIGEGVASYEIGDRVWQPTYTLDLARNAAVLMALSRGGPYTMACHGHASFFDLAVACLEDLGLAHRLRILPVPAARIAAATDKARRPDAAFMENRRLVAEGLDRQRPWRAALGDYLRRPWFKSLFADLPA